MTTEELLNDALHALNLAALALDQSAYVLEREDPERGQTQAVRRAANSAEAEHKRITNLITSDDLSGM